MDDTTLKDILVIERNFVFKIINRGKLWYDTLTPEQLQELQEWYQAWLDVTDTLVRPERPAWLK